MKAGEKNVMKKMPHKYRPLGAWKYFWLNVLFSIPVIGFIFLIVFACSGKNINRRSYARSFFCGLIIGLIVLAVIVVVGGVMLGFDSLIETAKGYWEQIMGMIKK